MERRSDPQLLVLHGLRLKGVAEPATVAEAVDLPEAEVEVLLKDAAGGGLAQHRDGLLPGWTLTPAGRTEHERLLAAEAEAEHAVHAIEDAYGRFRRLNPRVLDVCSRWQVRDLGGRPVRNDHHDRAYDRAVVGDLTAVAHRAAPLCDRLGEALERYRPYGPRLGYAAERVRAGDTEYFTTPVMPSFHTVWFELHEDLLATLGLDRSDEVASASSDRQGTT